MPLNLESVVLFFILRLYLMYDDDIEWSNHKNATTT